MGMGDVDCIYGREFLSIESDLHTPLHKISYGKFRKPRIDEDTYIFIARVFDIDEELGMSEGCDNHIRLV